MYLEVNSNRYLLIRNFFRGAGGGDFDFHINYHPSIRIYGILLHTNGITSVNSYLHTSQKTSFSRGPVNSLASPRAGLHQALLKLIAKGFRCFLLCCSHVTLSVASKINASGTRPISMICKLRISK